MRALWIRIGACAAALFAAIAAVGCGEFVREQGRSPSQVVVQRLEAASGAEPDEFGGTLYSDVITNVKRTTPDGQQIEVPTIFSDTGQVTMTVQLKNPGTPSSPNAPTEINQVTFFRYRVVFRRTDGRNTPGLDVPFGFDGAATFTVSAGTQSSASFEIVRHVAKKEAPLQALINSPVIISTIADVTFYGRDQAGNDVQANGSISVDFGNFGDPD